MSKPFSFRSWLASSRRRPLAKKNDLANKIAARLSLETLEDRLATGDLLGVIAPSVLNLAPAPAQPAATEHAKTAAVTKAKPVAKKPAPAHKAPPKKTTTTTGSKKPAAPKPAEPKPAEPAKPATPPKPTKPATPSSGESSNPLLGSNGLTGGSGPITPPASQPGTPTPTGGGSSSNPGGGSGGSGGASGGSSSSGGGAAGGSSASSAQMISATAVLDSNGNNVAGQVTNDKQPIIVGIAPAGASVEVFADGKKIGTVTTGGNGVWSMEAPNALADGKHTFAAAAAGASGSNSAKLMTTIYTKPPTVKVTVPEFADSQVAPTVSVAVTNDPYGYNSTVHYDVDLNGDGKFNDPGDTDYAVGGLSATLFNLPEGTFKIRVRVADNLGNVGVGYATLQVDPYAGYVADQNLLELATGWYNSPYMNNTQLMPGAWGIVPATGQDVSNGGGAGFGMPYNPNIPNPYGNSTPDAVDPQKIFFIDGSTDSVEIDARVTLMKYYSVFQQELEGLGMTINLLTPSSNMVTGYLPIDEIGALDSLPYFNAAVAELQPILRASASSEFQASPIILAPEFRASTGLTGAGQKVGVLSDSVNEFQGGLSQSVASGTLPNNVQVLQDDPSGTGTDEGRAMLEIVHNVAPGAKLAFATGGISDPSFAANILALQKAGSTVINDDIGYPDEPMFSVGRIGQAVDQVESTGTVYATAAGNVGNMGYRAAWSGITATVGGTKGDYQSFAGSPLQPFTLAPGDGISLSFCWSAAYLEGGSPLPNFQVPQNINVDVVDTVTGKILQTFNAGGQNINEAFQDVEFVNGSADSQLAFAFQLTKGPAPQAIGWVLQAVFSNTATDINALDEGASTLQGHTLANGAITVGAVPFTDPTQPESFSTTGGIVQIYSNDAGVPFSTPFYMCKPNVMAPDGVTVSFDLDGQPSFFGTSAATPSAAGAAALIRQGAPTGTAAQVSNHLGFTAEPLLTGGFNAETGDGLVQLTTALNLSNANNLLNNTSDTSIGFGAIGPSRLVINGSIQNSPQTYGDYNWFIFTAGATGTPSILMDNQNLEIHLFSYSNGYLTPVGAPTQTPFAIVQVPPFSSIPSIVTVGSGTIFPAGSLIYVEIKGSPTGPDSWTAGQYELTVSLNPV